MAVMDEKKVVQSVLAAIARRPAKVSYDYDPPSSASAALPPASRPFELKDPNQQTQDESADMIKVTIKQLKGGETTSISISKLDSIDELRKRIEKAFPTFKVDEQRLVLNGKALSDSKTLLDFNVENNATIHLLRKAGKQAAPAPAAAVEVEKENVFAVNGVKKEFWEEIKKVVGKHFESEEDSAKVSISLRMLGFHFVFNDLLMDSIKRTNRSWIYLQRVM
ncbi:Ubiquitin-like protein 4A [Blyttiomyces sp. JEL0837]|nr:Ubiquitin-like protein 4A [Blyttiomyces sp. JEL0837]